ncbi:hypothetical protein EGR_11221 [Echinococcus granulosus]|uniref:Uncharacterized protein n=1 Tax=Echinococcus granulosus TaxID=6210 RepID=W6U6E2_ECHGR|nr:hypothetical protein EGR_11221 [Echinococcus granulosus]EUB53922.1 hypothetical protein EGR_11221 [Echinococcus granulosus]
MYVFGGRYEEMNLGFGVERLSLLVSQLKRIRRTSSCSTVFGVPK